MTQNITLTVSDKQLEQFKDTVEELDGGTVTNPLLLLQLLLQNECDNAGVYADVLLDSGGNSIGDVLDDWSDCYSEPD